MIPFDPITLLGGVPADPAGSVLIALLVSFALGLVVTYTHRTSVPDRRVSASLQASLALLPVVAALVLLVIGDSLARAFSLVGALAIVRFRTRLRTTWDITFIFLALAAGIGCGVGKAGVATLGVAIAVLAVQVLAVLPGTRREGPVQVLRCDVAAWECSEAQLAPVLAQRCASWELAGSRSARFGEALSLTFHVQLQDDAPLSELVRALSQVEGVEQVVALRGDVFEGEETE